VHTTGEMSDACEFARLDQTNEILGLMMRHWNTIAGTLFKGEVYVPLLLENEDGVMHGNDWAHGFMRGMHMRHDGWAEHERITFGARHRGLLDNPRRKPYCEFTRRGTQVVRERVSKIPLIRLSFTAPSSVFSSKIALLDPDSLLKSCSNFQVSATPKNPATGARLSSPSPPHSTSCTSSPTRTGTDHSAQPWEHCAEARS
jgi:hypothetical protein